jgi:hypothetical protein
MRAPYPLSAAIVMYVAMSSLDGHAQTGKVENAEVEARRTSIRETARLLSTKPVDTSVSKNWKPARTPWGDPDIEGVLTNNDERLVPLERPAEFDGRKLTDFTTQELAWNARNGRAWLIISPLRLVPPAPGSALE